MWSNSIMFEKNIKAEIILFSFEFLLWGFPIKTYSFIFMLSKVNWKEMIVCWSVKRQQKHFKDFSIFVIHTRKWLYSCTRGFVQISNIWHKNNSRLRVLDLNIHEILMVDTRMWNILENVTSRIRLQKNDKKKTQQRLYGFSPGPRRNITYSVSFTFNLIRRNRSFLDTPRLKTIHSYI